VEGQWLNSVGRYAPTKGRHRREVPVIDLLRRELRRHKVAQPPGALCFGQANGRPFRPVELQERADAAWQAAGLERITLHPARHTAGSLWLAAHVPMEQVSEYLGHGSTAVTERYYRHAMPDQGERFTRLVDEYLREQTG
jgi:integrase